MQVLQLLSADQAYAWTGMFQLALAAILGGLIGLEREWRHRQAGFRTMILISMGSCLFTIMSIHGFPIGQSSAQDSARIAAQIVTGVGFLGAGALFQQGSHVKGLTTAATIWLVAALGMAVGAGAYILAIFCTITAFVTLRILLPVSQRIKGKEK